MRMTMKSYLLLATTLFRDLPDMNWFPLSNLLDKALSTSVSLLQIYGK